MNCVVVAVEGNSVFLSCLCGSELPKVSRIDSVYGRVNLRKVFTHVNTANLDMYAGAHAIITRNGRDFQGGPLRVYSPTEWLAA